MTRSDRKGQSKTTGFLEPLSQRRKGQAAIEYLMNYAWAIALIIIVGIAIFALDIGGVRTNLEGEADIATQQGEDVAIREAVWTVSSPNDHTLGNVTLSIENQRLKRITLNNVTVTSVNDNSVSGFYCTDVSSSSRTMKMGNITTCTTNRINGTADLSDIPQEAGDTVRFEVQLDYTNDETNVQFKPEREFTREAQAE